MPLLESGDGAGEREIAPSKRQEGRKECCGSQSLQPSKQFL